MHEGQRGGLGGVGLGVGGRGGRGVVRAGVGAGVEVGREGLCACRLSDEFPPYAAGPGENLPWFALMWAGEM